MPNIVEGQLTGGGRYGLIVSRFNSLITDRLLEGALDGLTRSGVNDADITVVRVPGSFEMPLVAKKMAASGRYDCLIGIGAVIRGGTPHFDFVASEVTKGLAQVSLEAGLPVVNAVITTDTIEQAVERAGTKAGNKGFDAARGAVEMVNLMGGLA